MMGVVSLLYDLIVFMIEVIDGLWIYFEWEV